MKKIIAFDFDGTLIKAEPAETAQQEWFNVMGYLLKSPKVKKLAGNKDYFRDVFNVLEKYTGLDQKVPLDRQVMTRFARNLFQMLYLANIRKVGKAAFYDGLIDIIVDHKVNHSIALVTTAPEDSVEPALEIAKIKDLFDFIVKSPVDQQPSKLEVFAPFVKKYGQPMLYVGNSVEDGEACKELGIPFVLCMWGKYDEDAKRFAKYKIRSPEELKSIINIES
ncbi:TPA: HAD family hydrolase [Candidatus Woesearchaeota archaeon]|nr:HAD family hydrolase [Candidatus Woesearchaeota archaeon]